MRALLWSASRPPLFIPSRGNAVFQPVMLQREVPVRRDPEAPEVTDSGKEKESLNKERISESGRRSIMRFRHKKV